jgi:hypothetical protein
MMATRHVVKSRANNKQVSRIKKSHTQMVAAHLTATGMGGGIIDLALPKSAQEVSEMLNAMEKFKVATVTTRHTDNPSISAALKNEALWVALSEWLISSRTYPEKLSIEEIAEIFCFGQGHKGTQSFQAVLSQHAQVLIDNPRSASWWEEQIRAKRKQLKLKKSWS